MSTSIGIAFSTSNDSLRRALCGVISKAGVGFAVGVDQFESDVMGGVFQFAESNLLQSVIALRSPQEFPVNLAQCIEYELTEFETKRIVPSFFALLKELARVFFDYGEEKLFVFFASEWEPGEEVRFSYGDINALISTLSAPGHWCLRLMDIESKRQWNSDRYPLIFEVEKGKNRGKNRAENREENRDTQEENRDTHKSVVP